MKNDFNDALRNEIATTLEREKASGTNFNPVELATRISENVQRKFKQYGWTEELNALTIPVGKSMSAGGVQD